MISIGSASTAISLPPVARISLIKKLTGEDVTEWYPAKDVKTKGAAEWTYDKQLQMAEQCHKGGSLFALGCGRLFEGDASTMWRSLSKLMGLPDATKVFCGHEYTLSNARFALGIDPDNKDLVRRAADVEAKRARGEPTIPSTVGQEKATNPFLRAADRSIRKRLGMEKATDAEVFAEIRKRKDAA